MSELRLGPAPTPPLEVFAARRKRLLSMIGDGVAVVPASRELVQSRDTEVAFRQSSDLYYLTGFPEPESLAVLTPHDPDAVFTLFVRPRDAEREAWTGSRVGVEAAGELFGADAVYPIDELSTRLPTMLRKAERIHYPVGVEPTLDDLVAQAIVAGRRVRQRTGTGPIGLVDLEVSTGEMRLVKEEVELERIRTAASIAARGHLAAIRQTGPGMGEWEVRAIVEAEFLRGGASPPAFLTIAGAGANATVLHYVANSARIAEGDLVLLDAGAEWGMYCSDITRTFPASGTFAPHQRDLYDIVLAAEEAGIAAARPGAPVTAVHQAVIGVLCRGLIDLGILKSASVDEALESNAYRRFYPHQSAHWLGLDVHDAGPYARAGTPVVLEPGMVLTVEPGVYLPRDSDDLREHFRGVGIRIEDDVIVGKDGPEVITREVPVTRAAIEDLMRGE